MSPKNPPLRLPIAAAAGLLLLAAAAPAGAEVAVRVDLDGDYRALLVSAGDTGGNVWGVDRRSRDASRLSDPLNPEGAAHGDLFPTVRESPVRPFHPWAVWSRPDGDGHHLLWSRWTQTGWAPVDLVGPDDLPGSDLDPRLLFDAGGTPLLTWWNAGPDALDDAGARVFISVFQAEGWSAPIAISPEGVDARRPELRVGAHGSVEVDYETPEGTLTQIVVLEVPDTITDDINPQYQLLLKGGPENRGSAGGGSGSGGSGGSGGDGGRPGDGDPADGGAGAPGVAGADDGRPGKGAARR